jgi:hypothetical protein
MTEGWSSMEILTRRSHTVLKPKNSMALEEQNVHTAHNREECSTFYRYMKTENQTGSLTGMLLLGAFLDSIGIPFRLLVTKYGT